MHWGGRYTSPCYDKRKQSEELWQPQPDFLFLCKSFLVSGVLLT